MPSPGKDEGGTARMITPGVSEFAAVRAETRVEREVEFVNEDRGMRREAIARLLPVACKI
jgi:hypothetical protein